MWLSLGGYKWCLTALDNRYESASSISSIKGVIWYECAVANNCSVCAYPAISAKKAGIVGDTTIFKGAGFGGHASFG